MAALVAVFCLYPLLRVLSACAAGPDGLWAGLRDMAMEPGFSRALWNSVLLGVVVSGVAGVLGYAYAFAVVRTTIRCKRFFHAMALLPIFSPPFVISLAVILLFGRSGLVSRQLLGIRNADVYGFASLAAVQVLALFPLAYLNVRGMLESMDGSVEEAARALGASGRRVFLDVTLPLGLPALLSSFLIVFAKSVSDFGNPQILAGDFSVLSVQAYLRITGLHDLRGGSFMAAAILLTSLPAFCIQRFWVARKTHATLSGRGSSPPRQLDAGAARMLLAALCVAVAGVVLLLYGTVVWVSLVRTWGVDMRFSWRNFLLVLHHGREAIVDTLTLSAVATPLTAGLGLALAFLLTRRAFPGRGLLGLAAFLPFAAPGVVLGIGYVLAFNGGRWGWLSDLAGGGALIVLAMTFRNIPVGMEAGANSLRQIDPSIEEASRTLGAGPGRTFRLVSLPLMRGALYTSLVHAFVRSMTSISAVIFLVSIDWRLLTASILSEVESGRLGAASAYCVVLMAIVAAAFWLMGRLVGRVEP